ncbi:MAG: HAD-IC family P-type ATPase, partial [Anaerolinea sp.]|nr:HAD-IC family P-type ATPase [Anaerolinea sp.]
MNSGAVLDELGTQVELGLIPQAVSERQQRYGKNILPSGEQATVWQILFNQFKNIMVIILVIAAVISGLLGDLNDVFVILVIVILNALLGTYQEYRAEQSLASLSALQVPLVRVRRAGKVQQIKAEELVPGDIVLLQEGDRVPADGRVILSVNLQVEEAALTGESHGVFKHVEPIDRADVALGDRTNMVFMGTSVAYGRGEMVVTAIGLQTELGKIAAMIMNVEEVRTPLQKRLDDLSTVLVRGALAIVAVVFFAGLLRGIPLEDMLLTAISLAVAAVPEGLPAIITISLSLGAARMVRRNALIRRLPAVETLGSVTVICSDKTGTLTRNEMMATQIVLPDHDDVFVTGIGYRTEGEFLINNRERLNLSADVAMQRILKAMALATDAYLETAEDGSISVVGDTTEGALLVAAQKVGWSRTFLEADMPRVAELPFSSDRKAMTTIHRVQSSESRTLFDQAEYVAITKGAPDRLLAWASHEHVSLGPVPLTDERRQIWNEQIDRMARRGLRVLGIAYRPLPYVPETVTAETERDLILIGLVGIVDPARPEAKTAVGIARGAGIRPIMITGDHALTAEAIAADLTIITPEQKAVTGA